MKRNAIVRIILFSIAILVLLGLLSAGLGIGMFMVDRDSWMNSVFHVSTGGMSGGTVSSVGSVNASEIREIEIEWASGSIIIEPSADTDLITFSETEQKDDQHKMVWKQSGDKLSIEFCETQVYIGISFDREKDLVITVPQDWVCKELTLDVASADVEISDLTIEEVNFNGASGICGIDNCNITILDVDTASGDVEFYGTLQQLDCDGASADCKIEVTNTPRKIDMDTASGDLDLTLPEECGFTVTMNALSSDFSSEFATTSTNGKHVYGDGSCQINMDAASGNVIIRKG